MIQPESNVAFDISLKQRNPAWGYREIQTVKQVRRPVMNMALAWDGWELLASPCS